MRSFVQAAPGTTRSCIGGHMENRNIDLGSSSAELLGSAPRQAEAGIVGERLLLWAGYAHAVQPPAAFPRHPVVPADLSGQPCASFVSPADPNYQALLAIINEGREKALAAPRVDMPGAKAIAGSCRHLIAPTAPDVAPPLQTTCDEEGAIVLTWEPSAQTIGLRAELHRSSESNFTPDDKTLLNRTSLFRYSDEQAPAGRQYYALVLFSDNARSAPSYAAIDVPPPRRPPVPTGLSAIPSSG